MPEIGKEHSGSELNLEVGESLELRLPENPTTGYRWQLRSSGSPVLELMEDSPSPAGEAVGAGRVRRWVFRAAQAGLARLELEQRRSWERQAVDSFNVAIRVKAQ